MQLQIIKLTAQRTNGDLPVSLDQVKIWLIVDHNEDDDAILQLIFAVQNLIEEKIKRPLTPTEVVFIFRIVKQTDFPFELEVPRIPLTDIVDISLRIDNEFVEQDLANYQILGDTITGFGLGTYQLTYLAGYEADSLPPALMQAMQAQIAFLYENRGDELVNDSLCEVAEKILLPYINMAWL